MKNNKQFKQDVDEYLEYLYSYEKKSNNTIESYKRTLDDFEFYLRAYDVDYLAINNKIAMNYFDFLTQKGNTKSYMNSKLYGIRSFYKYLVLVKRIKKNPFMLIKRSQVKLIERPDNYQIIDRETYKKCIDILLANKNKLKGHRNALLVTLLWNTGIRVSEVLAITKANFNDTSDTITIIGKGDKQNKLLLNKECQLSVLKYISMLEASKNKKLDPNEKLFDLTRHGVGYLLTNNLSNIIPNITAHTFRYSYAMDKVNSGISDTKVQQLLSHSSMSTTTAYVSVELNQFENKIRKIQNEIELEYLK